MKKPDYAALYTLRSDGRYMGYWHDKAGKRHAIYDRDPGTLHRKIEAREAPRAVTLKDVADAWEQKHREEISTRTWKNYAPHLSDIVGLYGELPIEELTAADVSQDLQAAKARGLSYTVVNTRRSIWRGLFDHAVGERMTPYNPALSVKNPKGLKKGRRTAPEDDVLTEILKGADSTDFPFIPFFLLCTGVRRSEALQRKKTDVDTKAWELSIPKAKTEAGVRTVPIISPLREPLKRWMEAHPGPWLFPYIPYNGRKGAYMTDSNWETAWAAFCAAHGWVDEKDRPTFGAHNLRHGTATLLYEAGVDVYTAQHILGHANVTTTLEIYTELRKKHERKNVGKFSRSLSKMLSNGGKKR